MASVKIANGNELKDGQAKIVQANGQPIALYRVNGKFYASQNNCLHRSGPLGEGSLEGETVTCPLHGWQYNVTTGQNVATPTLKLKVYKVEAKGDELFIEV